MRCWERSGLLDALDRFLNDLPALLQSRTGSLRHVPFAVPLVARILIHDQDPYIEGTEFGEAERGLAALLGNHARGAGGTVKGLLLEDLVECAVVKREQ